MNNLQLRSLVTFLARLKIPHSTESEMQEAIENGLIKAGIKFTREHRLSSRDVIDFLVGDVGIECKVKGQPLAIHRQVERYLKHDSVSSVIVVTAKHMGVKNIVNGKAIVIVQAGRSWL